jgi:hypothetical protein
MVSIRKPRRKSYREYDLTMPGQMEEVPVLRLIYILASILDPVKFNDSDKSVRAKPVHAVRAQVSSVAYKKEKAFGARRYDGDHMVRPIDFFTWAHKQRQWKKALLKSNRSLPCYKDAGGSLKGEAKLSATGATAPIDADELREAHFASQADFQKRIAKLESERRSDKAIIKKLREDLRKKRIRSAKCSESGKRRWDIY